MIRWRRPPINFTYDAYAADVLSGEQVACKWVRLACQRHAADLKTGHERGLYFDHQAAKVAIAFFSVLRHWKGEWAGQRITLQPWQQFIVASLFGWKRDDGLRRFRTAYISVGRKNGKTTMAAGIGLYLMVADGEPGAEVFSAAVKRDQARIVHRDAIEMVKRSPRLSSRIDIVRDNLHSVENSSKFEPLGRDADSTDGLNPHGIIADELHAWKDGSMWGVLETATGARQEPLMLAITTAGFDPDSYCMEQETYMQQVLEGTVQDDSYFGIIYTLDEEDMAVEDDAPEEEKRWWENADLFVKANPNLGVSKKMEYMRRNAGRASQIASHWAQFVTKDLNVWTRGEVKWVNITHWNACGEQEVDVTTLAGRECYAGLDLSSTTDVTAWVLVFPPRHLAEPMQTDRGEPYIVLPRFFMPEENVMERVTKDRVNYDVWIRDGYMQTTPGNMVDDDFIIQQIKEDVEAFRVQEAAFDRWGSPRIVAQLQDQVGFTVDQKVHEQYGRPLLVQFGQGFASMSGPMKELEKLILSHRLAHGNNPVLSWMAHNVVARVDAAENVKPDKSKSTERIDGIVALIMAIGRAMVHGGAKKSVYEERGIREV